MRRSILRNSRHNRLVAEEIPDNVDGNLCYSDEQKKDGGRAASVDGCVSQDPQASSGQRPAHEVFAVLLDHVFKLPTRDLAVLVAVAT